MTEYSEAAYAAMTERIFERFPSFQKVGGQAYKPGIDNMLFFDSLAGHPHSKYTTVHIAGTNGKGSVSNIIASVLAASGLRTGLYTSPHILDFRERMRILDGRSGVEQVEYIEKKEVWDFVGRWESTFDHLGLSFFEITTMMAFDWFASREVDIAVIETGLGGRFDSTNIIAPALSIITNIGLDHCDMLGNTLGEIAFEKAGIIKPGTPAVVGESDPETDPVFERKVLYTNLADAVYMGDRKRIMSLLTFADRTVPTLWERKDGILKRMDLQGSYQEKNLRTVLASLDVLASGQVTAGCPVLAPLARLSPEAEIRAIEHTAGRMDFHGRWEKLGDSPLVIADIGHNAHGLRYNFSQLETCLRNGACTDLIVVYGIVADKDLDTILPLMPQDAFYIFTNSSGKRALPAGKLLERYLDFRAGSDSGTVRAESVGNVADAVSEALSVAEKIIAAEAGAKPLVYIGGSTFVVSEALDMLKRNS